MPSVHDRGKKPVVPLTTSVPPTTAPQTGNQQPQQQGQQQPQPPPQQQQQPAPPPKSKMELLNEQTRAKQGQVGDKEIQSMSKLHQVFKGYKVGDERSYIETPDEDSTAEKVASTGLDLTDMGNTVNGSAQSIVEMAGEKLEKWSGGNGIVGAALSFIKYIKEAYDILSSDDSAKEKAGNLIKETAGTALDMAEGIMDAIEGLGGTILKGLKVIPGLSIVIDAVDIGIAVYRIVKAEHARVKMNDSRRLFKEKYLAKEVDTAPGEKTKMVQTVGKYNIRRLWKKTDQTVDEKAMKARRDQLLEKRKNDPQNFSEAEQAELTDILSYATQDRLRRVNRNKEFSNVGKIVLKLGSIAGKIAAMVGTFGGSAVAESVAGGIELAVDSAGLVGDASGMLKGIYSGRGARDKGGQYTKYLLEIIGSLPDTYDKPEQKMKYAQASDMVAATGVNKSRLLKQADAVVASSTDADKKKGRTKAFNMFIKLFDT